MTKCLVCASEASFSYDVPSDKIKRALSALFKDTAIWQVEIPDYRMFKCGTCQLEFADPPVPGSEVFYNWTVGHEGYYPEERWEYGVVRQRVEALSAQARGPLTVVDVGCGAGDFLGVLRGIPNVRGIGIDITAKSIATCRERGYEAYCGDLASAKGLIAGSIDVITAFHSLEHVADPLGFVCEARDLAGPTGNLMLSTPYSPMSFEENWFDPLNHPPHHLTRWNEVSYRALADRTGLGLTIIPGPVRGSLRRTVQAFALQLDLVGISASSSQHPAAFLSAALRRPVSLLRELFLQMRRRRLNHRHAPDVILVELKKTCSPSPATR